MGSSFWGLNRAGQTDRSQIPNIANWDWQQYQDWLARVHGFENYGDYARNYAMNYWQPGGAGGQVATPGQNWGLGQQIMPGVDPYVAATQQRWGQIQNAWNQLPTWQTTMNDINAQTDAMGRNITNNFQNVSGDITDTANRQMGRQDEANKAAVQNIYGAYNPAISNIEAYRTQTQGMYDQLGNLNRGAYGRASDLLRQMQPGSQLLTAQVARSYAPEISQTAAALRASGIDPNSPQGLQAMNNAQRDQARGMDESTAQAAQNYIAGQNALTLGGAQTQTGLTQNELNALNNINQQWNQAVLGRGGALGQQIQSNLAGTQGIDYTRLGQMTGAQNRLADMTNQYLQQRMGNDQLSRAFAQQDWQTAANILNSMSANDLANIGLQKQQYDAGAAQSAYGKAQTNLGAQMMGNIGQQQFQNEMGAGQMGLGYGQQATNNYLQSLGIEGANAGWGSKLLAGAAAGLTSLIPGVGPVLAPIVGGAIGGMGQFNMPGGGRGGGGGYGGGGGQYGGGWGGQQNPYQWSFNPNSPTTGWSNPFQGSQGSQAPLLDQSIATSPSGNPGVGQGSDSSSNFFMGTPFDPGQQSSGWGNGPQIGPQMQRRGQQNNDPWAT